MSDEFSSEPVSRDASDDGGSDSDGSVHENIVTRTPGARLAHLSVDSFSSPALSEQDFEDGLRLLSISFPLRIMF